MNTARFHGTASDGTALIALPTIPLSVGVRAALERKRDALKVATVAFTPATHNLLVALDPDAVSGSALNQREQVTFLQTGLAEAHRNFLTAFGDAFAAVRAAMRQPVLDLVANQMDAVMASVFKNKFLRRAAIRRSALYRNTAAVFDRVERFYLLPVDVLHSQAQSCLQLCDAVLAGNRLSVDPATGKFHVGLP